jgi:type I restriction enzyme R subunit
LEPVGAGLAVAPPPNEVERLSEIIRQLNERFGTQFNDKDKVFLQDLEARLEEDLALANSVRVNTRDNARLTFDHVATDKVQDMIDMNFKFYKQITDDPEFGQQLFDWLFERYVKRMEREREESASAA